MKRHDARTDANQPEIVEVLRGIGAKVWYIWRPLDLLVAFRGVFYILEVKTEDEKPSSKQRKTITEMESCGCPVHVVHNVGEALHAIGAIEG